MRGRCEGFTLMEMLLVPALIGGVSVAVFSALNNGVKLWSRGIAVDHKGELFIGMERIAQDLRGVLPFSLISFRGSPSAVSFATIVLTPADVKSGRASEGLVDQLGAVEYRYEPSDGTIIRRQADYGQAIKKQWGLEQVVATGVSEVRFDYFMDGDRKVQRKEHVDARIPSGILLTLRLGDNGQQTMERFFEIPTGGQ